jgi:hypothetical protein
VRDAVPAALVTAEDWIARGLTAPRDPVLGFCLGVAALAASEPGALSDEARRRFERVSLLGALGARFNMVERPMVMAARGLLDLAQGRERRGLRRYERAIEVARRHRFLAQAALAEEIRRRIAG